MMIVEYVRNILKTCPLLEQYKGGVRIGVDFLGAETTTYSIESAPTEPTLKQYINGSRESKVALVFSSREQYGEDVLNNLSNSGFYEGFERWLYNKTINSELPVIDNNRKPISLKATSTGYVFNAESQKAQYQINLEFIYFEGVI